VAGQQFTLHRVLWRAFRRLPRVARIWIVLVVVGALIKVLLLSAGPSEEQRVGAAVAAAVREATGPTPASSCYALSPAGLSELLGEFGGGEAATGGAGQLTACRQLVLRLRAEATPQQLSDFARGSVRSVQLRPDGSALVVYLAADRRLGAELTMSQRAGRWLIDSVAGGAIAGTE
jgi:hypothetical protein